jgi:hypothetical protein
MTLKNDCHPKPSDRHLQARCINMALDEMLRSAPFTSSRQSQKLLRYLVEKSILEDEDALKERIIGVEVFGRPNDYNTGDDPIVRARIGEVRKRLAQYYHAQANDVPNVRFEIPVGSYRVLFHFRPLSAESEPGSIPMSNQPLNHDVDGKVLLTTRRRKLRMGRLWMGALTLGVLIFILSYPLHSRLLNREPNRNAFWAPLVKASPTIFVYIGENSAYMPTASFMKRFRETHSLDEDQMQGTLIRLDRLTPNEVLRAGDVYPENDDLVSSGNVAACVAICSLLQSMHRTPDVRSGLGLSPEDLKDSAAVFIGAFDNKWTMQLSTDLPFQFQLRENEVDTIVEKDGQHREWKTNIIGANGESLEEYAIVARLTRSKLRRPVIIAAGLRARGTRAAGDFIADSAATDLLLKNAPANWSHNNLEVVLVSDTIKGGPGLARVIAARYW